MFDTIDAQVLHTIITGMVNEKDKVVITRTVTERGVVLNVQVALKDMGIIIGRKGAMAEHIKMVMRAIAKSNGMIVNVVFLEPDGSTRHYEPYNHDGDRDNNDRGYNNDDRGGDRGYNNNFDNRGGYDSRDSRNNNSFDSENSEPIQPITSKFEEPAYSEPAKPKPTTSIVDELDLDSLIIN
jgi:predicted RNA-binding protein YlqC (UPF0109 family)